MKNIIVAGCGPAGMMAAIAAARSGAKVTILEGMEKPGKKLLITGNGRCNLTNLDPDLPNKYYSVQASSEQRIQSILQQFSVRDTLDFFRELGLLITDRNGYVYPYTGQASSVLDLLLAELKRWKVKLKFTEKIQQIEKSENGWNVKTNSWMYPCDAVILCCGSKAAPITGSDGSGYELALQLGHHCSSVAPSLTALIGKSKYFSTCAGVRSQAKVSLYVEDQNVAEDQGELQWIENGISGIVIFQVSRFAALALEKGQKVTAKLDLLPLMNKEELLHFLFHGKQVFPKASLAEVYAGLLPKKLLQVCLEINKLKPGSPVENLSEEQLVQLSNTIKEFQIPIKGIRSFDQCQVCAGGILLEETEAVTLESKIAPGIYFAGELLDVDGPCGGYNLQWAWSSGYVAGKHAAADTKEEYNR